MEVMMNRYDAAAIIRNFNKSRIWGLCGSKDIFDQIIFKKIYLLS
jgi:hypothetical protein